MNTEKELFTITAEECAELIQVCMKTVRFGMAARRKELVEEVGDVSLMIDLLIKYGYITQDEIAARKEIKRTKLKKFSNLIEENI